MTDTAPFFTPIGTFPTTASTSPQAVGGNMNGVANQRRDYYWNKVQRRVEVQSRNGWAGEIMLRWNAYDASPTLYNRCLAPGDVVLLPPGLAVARLSLYFTADATYGTHFIIQGWE